MMTRLLSSRGIRVSELRVGKSLNRVSPAYYCARSTDTAHPVPYQADYFEASNSLIQWSIVFKKLREKTFPTAKD